MQNLRNKLIVGGAVLILAAIGSVMNRQAAQAQGPGGPTVTIGSPLPLPVTGTVAATQSGPWNVNLAGTPNVHIANPSTTPALTLYISKSASQLVNLLCVSNTNGTSSCAPNQTPLNPYSVPAGQNLVMTSVDISEGTGLEVFMSGHIVGFWSVPNDGTTHSFVYPSGIVFPPNYTFGATSVVTFSTTFAYMHGYLTPL